jgi:autotransporter passenger strand-loop-strand repeat protein
MAFTGIVTGSVSNELISSGVQNIYSGGTAYYTLINYNGNQLVDGAASPLTSANAALTYDPLKKSPGMLAS